MYCYECLEKIENEIKIFTCQKCKKKIHNDCLLYSNEQIENLKINECDNCRLNIENKFIKKKCSICDCDGSKYCLHKWINVNKLNYVHQKCAKWFLKIDYELENNFIIFKSKKPLSETFLLYDGKCHFCKKNPGNFFIKCKADGCENYTHEQCIYKHPFNYQKNGKYHFDFYCDEHKDYIKSKKIETMKTENIKNNNKENNLIIKKGNNIINQKIIYQNKNNSLEKLNNNIKNLNHNNDFNQSEIKQENNQNNKNKIIKKRYGNIITIHKCLLCNIEISFNLNEIKNNFYCKKCLSYYHLNCIEEYNKLKKIKKEIKCPICLNKEEQKEKKIQNKKCLICNISNECSLIINNIQFHYICLIPFPECLNLDLKKINIKTNTNSFCCICQKNGLLNKLFKCFKCEIVFHPYCAVKNNFNVKIINGKFISKCNKIHKMFLFNNQTIDIKNFEFSSLKNKNNKNKDSTSSNSNKKIEEEREKKKIKKKLKFKNHFCIKTNVTKKNEEYISSLNYGYLKSLLQKKKIFDIYLFNKIIHSNNKKFNWDISNYYFYDFTKEELDDIFLELNDYFLKDNFIINIDEDENKNYNNNILLDNKYSLVEINKISNQINNYFLALFNKSKVEKIEEDNCNKMDIDDSSEEKKIKYDNNLDLFNYNNKINEISFISHKRGLLNKNHFIKNKNFNNKLHLGKLKFLKGIKINRLIYYILTIESKTSYPKEKSNDFIEESIFSKRQMLYIIKQRTKLLINKIKKEYEKDYINIQERKNKEIENKQLLKKYKALEKYTKISSHLKNGIKPKNYLSIIGHLTIKNQEKNKITNIKEYIKNQYKNDSECCICFDINQDEDIIFCDKCNTSYHASCYGIKEIPIGNYYCDKCEYELNNKDIIFNNNDIKCLLCNSSHGALKYIVNLNCFVHITCILISKYFYFNNFVCLNYLNRFKEFNNMNFDICYFCNCNKGELFKCNCCDKFYHFFCIYFDGGNIIIEKNIINNEIFSLNLIIDKCKNDLEWNNNNRKEQIEIRKLIYQKNNNQIIEK